MYNNTCRMLHTCNREKMMVGTLYFSARQVGHKRGNTRNRGFQLAPQQCYETKLKKNVAGITGPLLSDLAGKMGRYWSGSRYFQMVKKRFNGNLQSFQMKQTRHHEIKSKSGYEYYWPPSKMADCINKKRPRMLILMNGSISPIPLHCNQWNIASSNV